jgi:hypothetical protein
VYLYRDGVPDGSVSGAGARSTNSGQGVNISFKDNSGCTYAYVGLLDEIRVSSVVRSADWIRTEYSNMYRPDLFISVGNEEASPCSPPPAVAWYSCGWTYRKNITINSSMVNGTLSNFPVIVNLSADPDLKVSAQANGNDILFTRDDGTTRLYHEIENYTSSTGALLAWVNVTSVSNTTPTTIMMYYNNSGAENQQYPKGVWWNGYSGVWHLKENPAGTAPQMTDSGLLYNGTSGGSMTASDQVAGKIDGSLDFDGSNDYITVGNAGLLSLSSTGTLSAWVKFNGTPNQYSYLVGRSNNGNPLGQSYLMALLGGGDQRIRVKVSGGKNASDYDQAYTGTNSWTSGAWYYIVGEWNNTYLQMYINGTPDGAAVAQLRPANTTLSLPVQIGCGFETGCSDYDNAVNGTMDEVRISYVARSADWIRTEYNNMNRPNLFISVGSQVASGCSSSGVKNLQVGASTDDCDRWGVNSFFTTLTSDRIDTFSDNSYRTGLRFTGVTIPQGATINTAYLTLRAKFTAATPGSAILRGQAADNPATFSTFGDFDTRTRTTANATWAPSAWVVDTDYTSPELKSIVQEIVNRPGWASGNAMVMIFNCTGSQTTDSYSYDSNPTYAPKLHIEYT